MAYLFLVGAIIAEVIATSLLKSTEGFSRLWPTIGCLTGYAVAFALLAQSISRGMQVGVGYALWSALGTTLIVVIGVLFLNEPMSAAKVAGVGLVVAGVVVLNFAGAH
ncbi:multidrug efflux SMR transporter [Antrihabitans sp. YC2-6]|uniref:DMT family transporter n=1 Tax=Antrihabitans sp. YC2-6 TaxID=2799498 RepID=UPI0018F58D64|nr:SMR family transporter [Antrihabitans sp. YC2-6]MBJ8348889.1 multidrug efflux SMR transporter [Antrihabitans sp. YC2-6]